MVESALTLAGITKERVSHWLGKPCNCKERQAKLNQLGIWTKRVLAGKLEKAQEFLDQLITE
jgi:hypothetical protein